MATQQEIMAETNERMQKSLDALSSELDSFKTGRASPGLVENLTVDYYGVPTPLKQLATVSAPQARVLTVQPWDKQSMAEVERCILKSDLGLMPNNDGTVIRINIPSLTEERRKELIRLVGRKVEDGHVAVRNIRRDSLKRLRDMEKGKILSRDEVRRAQEQLQQVTDTNIVRIDELRGRKEAEVMEV